MDAHVNPLLTEWDRPFGLPPFECIEPRHFRPALEHAMRMHRIELAAVASDPSPPDFDNTIAAFDRSGELLERIEAVFDGLTASATSPELQAVQRALAAPLAAHWSAVQQDVALFERLDTCLLYTSDAADE